MRNVAFEGAQAGYSAKKSPNGGLDYRNFDDGNDLVEVDHSAQPNGQNHATQDYMAATLDVERQPIFRLDEMCAKMNEDGFIGMPGALDDLYKENIVTTTPNAPGGFQYRASTNPATRLPRIIERGTYKRPSNVLGAPAGTEAVIRNAGRLGKLDDPDHCDRIWGTAGGQFMDIKSV
jgi:hypothetical protein